MAGTFLLYQPEFVPVGQDQQAQLNYAEMRGYQNFYKPSAAGKPGKRSFAEPKVC